MMDPPNDMHPCETLDLLTSGDVQKAVAQKPHNGKPSCPEARCKVSKHSLSCQRTLPIMLRHRPFRSFYVALPLAAALLGLSGCANRPDLSGRVAPVDATQAWPSLLSSATLSATPPATEAGAEAATALAQRAAALAARGRTLSRTPVLTQAERARLLAALARTDAPS